MTNSNVLPKCKGGAKRMYCSVEKRMYCPGVKEMYCPGARLI